MGSTSFYGETLSDGERVFLCPWRRHPDSNWGIELLQSSALPLGYAALCK